ncbi:His Kinase A (phospho-acceptor) domain-containing protein [Desulfonauticus submarinus]|uniref:histidine kinase n=1 Tax=Desulfonauticus submarinus TaxID=206665 RepID=A0A1H0D868_9BACT|nr:HAMP domain-containing sensor histidine kinase [Desulfonauticus submarinus]SDN66279.1 His Kinase A (phospho-acceptor) domain-containing protein [Desulfonauticus submarinus]
MKNIVPKKFFSKKKILFISSGIFIFLFLFTLLHLFLISKQLKRHIYLDAREALSFVELRFLSYQETISILKNVPPYLKNPAWLIDEFQSHPILYGVLIWSKNKIILSSFPHGQIPSVEIIKNSQKGLEQDNLFYLSSYFSKSKDIGVLVAIYTDFKRELWKESLFHSLLMFFSGAVILFVLGVYIFFSFKREETLIKHIAETEKLATVGKFSSLLAHEVKNPLNTLSMGLQYLQEDLTDKKDFLQTLLSQVDRLNILVEELLAVTKGLKIIKKEIFWKELSEQIYNLLLPLVKAKELELYLDEKNIVFQADKHWLERALLNLLRNALEAVEPRKGKVELNIEENNNRIYFIIKDNGPGMEKEIKKSVKKLFYTTKKHGFGLGLYLAHQVAIAHGGGIDIWSKPKQGTKIRLWIDAS